MGGYPWWWAKQYSEGNLPHLNIQQKEKTYIMPNLEIQNLLPAVKPATPAKVHATAKLMAGYNSEPSFQHDKTLCEDFILTAQKTGAIAIDRLGAKRFGLDGRTLTWGDVESADKAQTVYLRAHKMMTASQNTAQKTSDRFHGAELLKDAVEATK